MEDKQLDVDLKEQGKLVLTVDLFAIVSKAVAKSENKLDDAAWAVLKGALSAISKEDIFSKDVI